MDSEVKYLFVEFKQAELLGSKARIKRALKKIIDMYDGEDILDYLDGLNDWYVREFKV